VNGKDEKYDTETGTVTLSGMQALVRLGFEQRRRDRQAGLNTGGFICGYRGSPLGTYDQELWRVQDRLVADNIRFQPGVNEDLAATAVWGTQYVNLYPGAKVDGVFGIWYGKTPGVERSGDALHHANTAGTSPTGGVLALAGDDHAAKSSSRTGQSDNQLKASGLPILYPSNVQEILDFGLHGIAMSRYTGCWVSLKLATDVVETTAEVEVGAQRPPVLPELPDPPAGGMHIRPNEPPQDMEARLYNHKLPAAVAYARANRLNRIEIDAPGARFGIVSAGKSWGDVRGALTLLGLDDEAAAHAGLRLLKIGMIWPLDPKAVVDFAEGLERILVVEEKRPFLEEQVKSVLFDSAFAGKVEVYGKANMADGVGRKIGLPAAGELSPPVIARAIAALAGLPADAAAALQPAPAGPVRMPNFCSGCPHNTSTVVPEGSRTMAGIGCHGMAMWIRPESTGTITHMGGEGMLWVGQSPFTEEAHVFVNIGDGTFFHSGSLALRQAVAAKARMTYKVLFNGYVSMTGGQPHDGELSVQKVVDIGKAEGVGRIVVVADDVGRYSDKPIPGVPIRPRDELDAVQRELREYDGVSMLVYDQACATEMRRQRKRDPALDIPKRTWIHPEVCEGCGDCGVRSNCMSVEPLETDLGRKRRINQSTCNKDFSCVEGFCPSFVTVHGGRLRRKARQSADAVATPLPEPALAPVDGGYNVVLAGIGGTGIVTVGNILAAAAHLDGLNASVLDLTGMAQKYGAVMSHVRLMPRNAKMPSARLAEGEADLVVGCDLIVAAGQEALSKMAPRRTLAVVNSAVIPTGDFTRAPDWDPNAADLIRRIETRTNGQARIVDAERIATALMGDSIATNMFLLGYAWQLGRVPVSLKALDEAIAQSGVDVEFNRGSFFWGRRMAADPDAVEREIAVPPAGATSVIEFAPRKLDRLDDVVRDRMKRLADYQDDAYAQRYSRVVEKARAKDQALGAGDRLARAVAIYYYKLLAHKDEYEVARLFSTPEFRRQISAQFDGDYTLHFHFGAWPLVRTDGSGRPRKREVGPWALRAMGVLQRFRRVRGTWVDPFRNSPERKLANQLLANYEADIDLILERASAAPDAIALASLPEKIRGYGHVRERNAAAIDADRQALRAGMGQRGTARLTA
jgi:indolepyruvate ferredoxin oxidoreductase